MSLSFPHVNYLAILVSAVAIFILGGLWYSVIFKKPWVRLMGIPEEKMKEGAGKGMPVLLFMSFLCGLLISYVEAIIINHFPPMTCPRGMFVGTLLWAGFAAPTSFATAIFSMTPKKLWFINSAYNWVSFMLAGIILSVWR